MTVMDVIEYIISLKGGSEAAGEAHKVRSAMGGLREEIKGVGKESPKAAAATTMLGGSFGKLAKGIVAAGLAYKAYSAAKSALNFTDELVHSTTTLTGATHMSVQQASRWIGVAEALGVRSTAVTTGFSRMASEAKRQLEAGEKQTKGHEKHSAALTTLEVKQRAQLANAKELAAHTKNAAAGEAKVRNVERTQLAQRVAAEAKETTSAKSRTNAFEILGISVKELKKHSNDMSGLMTLVVKKFKDLHNPVLRGAALTKIFGRSYAELGPLLLGGSEQLEHFLGLAKKYGVEIKASGQKGLEEYHERVLETKLATEGLQLRFSELAIGPLKRVQEGFLAVGLALRTGKWGDVEKQAGKLGEAIGKLAAHVLPVLAGSFAKMGPVIAKALWTAFTHASTSGQLLMVGVLMTKLGFTKLAFKELGGSLGTEFAAGILAAAVGAYVGYKLGMMIRKWLGLGKHEVKYTGAHGVTKGINAEELASLNKHEQYLSHLTTPQLMRYEITHPSEYPGGLRTVLHERGVTHESDRHGDIVINVDGRQLIRITNRQLKQLQAQGAG